MAVTAKPITRVVDELSRLPGIGPKTAQRLAYHLLRSPKEQTEALAAALTELKERVVLCAECFNITERSPCELCAGPDRDASRICVVEEPLDVVAIERTGQYKGKYHVLHGALSPIEGIGPEELKVRELLHRLGPETVEEVILATNPNLEGDATSMYLTRLIQPLGITITRLARGLPVGGDLEYADEITLGNALAGRSRV
ncbi:MAG TPA: recombination protein RecR [Chloroflexi bacterium]|jgi:recombination protein RecR|nr:recombination protein RecR [Chloroflexota bacterium]